MGARGDDTVRAALLLRARRYFKAIVWIREN
jgi:hypothetical protein